MGTSREAASSNCGMYIPLQGRIQDLIKGGAPDRDRPKTAILGPQFCRILVLGPHFWWSGGAQGSRGPPLDPPLRLVMISIDLSETTQKKCTGNPRQNSVEEKFREFFF